MMKILTKSLELAHSLVPTERNQNTLVYAFIYDGNTLLSIGQNDMKNENAKALYFGKRYKLPHLTKYPYVHAELDAISKLWGKRKIDGSERVVVVRFKSSKIEKFNKNFVLPALAKPCDNCYTVLCALGINRIYWTTEDGWNRK